MSYGATGFDLEIDLSRGNIEKLSTDPKMNDLHLGGQGVAAKMLWDRVPPEVEPFSPRNLLIFSVGHLVGTPVPGANRTSISSISPQSNLYVHSGFEGFFGAELKHAGYDNLLVRGKSTSLVYLWINNDKVEIRDASHLQGKSALETTDLIRQELNDPYIQVAAIGMAGENKVAQASIEHANSCASHGVGVIMGDKGLKAIAVRGSQDIALADQSGALFEECNRLYRDIYDNPHCGDVLLSETDDSWHVNNLPFRNAAERVKGFWDKELEKQWKITVEREEVVQQWENYSQEMEEHIETVVETTELLRGTGCYNCPKECHKVLALPGERKYFLKSYAKLAYAMAAYADLSLNYNVLVAMQEFGLDEAATLQALSFALELYAAGVLSDKDLPDFPVDGTDRLLYLIEKIAKRDGVGDALACGLVMAACQFGKGAEAYVSSVKKIEQLPLQREDADYAYFLMLAAGEKMDITQVEGSFPQRPLPDSAMREEFVAGWHAAPEKFKQWFLGWEPGQQLPVDAAVNIADWNESMHCADDTLGICPLLSSFRGQYGGRPCYHLYNLPELYTQATGRPLDSEQLLDVSRRNRQLVRAINVRRGLRREDDAVVLDLWSGRDPEVEQQHLDAYYEFKGWTADGIPSKESLVGLGLGDVCDDLVSRGIHAES